MKILLSEDQYNRLIDEGRPLSYTEKDLEKIKKKYKGRPVSDFKNGEDKSAFNYVYYTLGKDYYKEFTKDMVRTPGNNMKYTDDVIKQITKKYKGKLIADFINDHPSLYRIIGGKGIDYFNDVTKDMVRKTKTWTDKEIEDEAKKYNNIKDFTEKSPKAYGAAKNRGPFVIDPKTGKERNTMKFYRKVTAHMTPLGSLYKRLIYVHEFRYRNGKPAAAYVGLTYNSDKRYKQHVSGIDHNLKQKDTPVTTFMRENPTLKHTYKLLTDYLDKNEAVIQERYWEDKYKEDGWLILSIKRAGSLGGNLKIKNEDIKDFLDLCYNKGYTLTQMRHKFPNQINMIYARGLHLPPYNYLEKFDLSRSKTFTDQSAFDAAMQNKTYSDFVKNKKMYDVIYKRGLLDKVKKEFLKRSKKK
jgi:predicted GIY-YIG superfamily endonuclease